MSVYSRQRQNAQGGFGAENPASDLSTQVHGRRKLHIRHRAVRCTLQIRYCNGRPHEVQDMCVIRRRREAREPQNACEGGGGSRWVSPPIAVRIEKKGRQATTAIVANLLADSSSRPIERSGRLQHRLHRPSAGCSLYFYRFVCGLPRAPNPFPLYAL